MKNRQAGVYIIWHAVDPRYYLGSTLDIVRRWKDHQRDLRLNRHVNPYLQILADEVGWDTLNFTVLECTPPDENFVLEQKLLDLYFDDIQCLNVNPTVKIYTKHCRKAQSKAMNLYWSSISAEKRSEIARLREKGKSPAVRGATCAKMRSMLSDEDRRAAGKKDGSKRTAQMTQQEKDAFTEVGSRTLKSISPEQRSINGRCGAKAVQKNRSEEDRLKMGCKLTASLTQEALCERARKGAATREAKLTPEQRARRRLNLLKRHETRKRRKGGQA